MQAIIFDCDGVLVDSESILLRTERDFLKQHGVTYSEHEFKQKFLGVSGDRFREILSVDYKAATGQDLTDEISEMLKQHAHDSMFAELDTIPGMFDLVREVAHLPIAVASNSYGSTLNKKLAVVGLDQHFTPHIYSRDDVVNPKPAPDLYLHAASSLGYAPMDCLVVEDSALGARAAVHAGMTVIGFAGGEHIEDEQINGLHDAGVKSIAHNADELAHAIADLRRAVA